MTQLIITSEGKLVEPDEKNLSGSLNGKFKQIKIHPMPLPLPPTSHSLPEIEINNKGDLFILVRGLAPNCQILVAKNLRRYFYATSAEGAVYLWRKKKE